MYGSGHLYKLINAVLFSDEHTFGQFPNLSFYRASRLFKHDDHSRHAIESYVTKFTHWRLQVMRVGVVREKSRSSDCVYFRPRSFTKVIEHSV